MPRLIRKAFELEWIIWGDSLRRLVNDDALLLDSLRILTRPYEGICSHDLWRAESALDYEAGRIGISWAQNQKAAHDYSRAHSWLRRGGTVILSITATPEAIICFPQTSNAILDLILTEVLIDPRRLVEPPRVIERIAP